MKQLKGFFFGLLASICYGFIPLFTIPISTSGPLKTAGLADESILFYRFLSASIIVAVIMLIKRKSFKVTRSELVTLIYLAFISDGSALFLIDGYNYMSSGAATTLHFMYPVVTTLIMLVFYHEARRLGTLMAVVLSVLGVALLCYDPDGQAEVKGIIIVLLSAVCYALYIIRVNRSRVRNMDGYRITFYVMSIGTLIFAGDAFRQDHLQLIPNNYTLYHLLALGIICTVVTNLALVASVKAIGSTMTSVLGALEPLTAVALGCLFLNEKMSWNVGLGILMIIIAVVLVIATRNRAATAPQQIEEAHE